MRFISSQIEIYFICHNETRITQKVLSQVKGHTATKKTFFRNNQQHIQILHEILTLFAKRIFAIAQNVKNAS